MSPLFRSFLISLPVWILAGCTGEAPPPSGSPATPGSTSTVAPPPREFTVLTDVTARSGVDFRSENGFDGENWRVVETITGGLAIADFDGDGRLDLFFTCGRRLTPGDSPVTDRLYAGNGDGTFRDRTREAGVGDPGFSLGCSVADVDGDGDLDLFVTADGPDRLYFNDGQGRFTERAAEAGVAGEGMSTGSAFLDADGDGDLDLYVATYAHEEKESYPPALLRGIASYWPPRNYPGRADHFYENLGDGTFRNRSEASGIRAVEPERGLGVIASDLDGDGKVDLFVANDMGPNFMFLGDGKGHFTEEGFFNGTALGETGEALGSMGVAVSDVDGDGRLDLAVTNYQDQLNNLYRGLDERRFVMLGRTSGFAAGSLSEVGWGILFADLDLDGLEDAVLVNGHLNPNAHLLNDGTRYAQPDRILKNRGGGRFEDVSEKAGVALAEARVSRGVASGDLDGDGDLDLVITHSEGAPRILLGEPPPGRHWLAVRLRGRGKNRGAIGARVSLELAGRVLVRERRSSESYLSSSSPLLHFGLGKHAGPVRLVVRWPEGDVREVEVPAVDRVVEISADTP